MACETETDALAAAALNLINKQLALAVAQNDYNAAYNQFMTANAALQACQQGGGGGQQQTRPRNRGSTG